MYDRSRWVTSTVYDLVLGDILGVVSYYNKRLRAKMLGCHTLYGWTLRVTRINPRLRYRTLCGNMDSDGPVSAKSYFSTLVDHVQVCLCVEELTCTDVRVRIVSFTIKSRAYWLHNTWSSDFDNCPSLRQWSSSASDRPFDNRGSRMVRVWRWGSASIGFMNVISAGTLARFRLNVYEYTQQSRDYRIHIGKLSRESVNTRIDTHY